MAFFESLQGRQPGEPKPPAVPGGSMRPSMPAQVMNPPAVNSAPAGRPPMPGGITPGGFSPGGVMAPRPDPPGRKKGEIWPDTPNGAGAQQQPAPGPGPQDWTARGGQVLTPYGEIAPDGTMAPSPDGAMQYQQAIVRARQSFGSFPLSDMPGVPQPPIRLGGSFYNPFQGSWGRAS